MRYVRPASALTILIAASESQSCRDQAGATLWTARDSARVRVVETQPVAIEQLRDTAETRGKV